MKTITQCSSDEVNNYTTAQQDAIDTHSRGIAKLLVRNGVDGISNEEHEDNLVEIADLRAERGILRARRDAFYADKSAINPPSKDQLKALKKNLNAVSRLSVKRKIASKVVALATSSVTLFNQIQPG